MKSKLRNNMFVGDFDDLTVSDFPTSYRQSASTTVEAQNPPAKPSVELSGNSSESDDYKPTDSDPDMEKVKHFSKNKTMTYAGTQAQTADFTGIQDVRNKLDRYLASRTLTTMPPGYYDNYKYQHRIDASILTDESVNTRDSLIEEESDPDRTVRIGDCSFIIPPEFISVTTSSSHEAIQGIRQSGSTYIKNGYSRKEIQISLVLNGMDQINGYEVESPIPGTKYHVDGLRHLLSQFKFTPFLPIQNNLINIVHGIANVALRNIAVETINGFPETLNVTLSLQEFNIESLCPYPNDWFDDCIDWDLFRWYTQRPLIGQTRTKFHKITTPKLTSDFSFKILSHDALMTSNKATGEARPGNAIQEDELFMDLTNDKNYVKILDSSNDLELTYLGFDVGNVMPVIQMSFHESPFMQYMGATDTNFTFGFQTKDPSVAQLFDKLNKESLQIVRSNRFTNGIGFIKIENELVKLTGTEFMIMSSISVSTVPSFPGLFNITVNCISYDANQSNREKLIGLKPFDGNRNGTRDDLITQYGEGVMNKIKQDCAIERNLQKIELYPDLELPTYDQTDKMITLIRKYRTRIGTIEQLPYKSYPRHVASLPGSPKEAEYNGYVDPDFYTFSPIKLTDQLMSPNVDPSISAMNKGRGRSSVSQARAQGKLVSILENGKAEYLMDIFKIPEVHPDVAIEPKFTYGWETNIRTRVHKGFLSENDMTGSGAGESSSNEYVEGGSGGSGAGVDPVSVTRRYGNPFLDLLCDRADSGCGYVWAADGQILNSNSLQTFKRNHGSGEYTGENDVSHWMGKQVFDCSGFICWALRKVGLKGAGWRVVSGSFGGLGVKVSKSELRPGDVCYNGVHAAVYIGDGKTVEAMNPKVGVKYGKVSDSLAYVRISGLDDANNKFLQNNPNFYKKTATSTSGGKGGVIQAKAKIVNNNDITPRSTDSKEVALYSDKETRIPIGQMDPVTGVMPGTSRTPTSNLTTFPTSPILGNFGDGDPCDKWNDLILKHCRTYNLDPNFIKTIIKIESGGNPNAISFASSQIVGLMQVHQLFFKVEGPNPFDPSMNIKRGCQTWVEYGAYDYVKYDKERWLCAYNAGIGYCKWVYVDRTHQLPSETANYIVKYNKIYAQLIANGGRAGSTTTPTDGGMTAIGGTGDSGAGAQEVVKPKFEWNEADFTNPNVGKVHGDKLSGINVAIMGRDFLDVVATATDFKTTNSGETKIREATKFKFDISKISTSIKLANDPAHAIEYMLVDFMQYSSKGLLVRAFPSYLLIFLDEQQEWCDEKKLWTNYYVCRSALDINVFEDYSSPSKIAKVSLMNFHNNLTHAMKATGVRDTMDGWFEGDTFRRIIYETTGAIFDQQITDKMISIKNHLYTETKLKDGARVHIRMGYGSNPARYPTVFNGTITDISEGEIVEFVAQGDGRELVLTPITDKTSATNKDVGLPVEVSNLIVELLVKRESPFLYAFTFGNFKIRSAYGIEHFGQHFYKLNTMNYLQYDIIKNVYKGTYKGTPFSKSPFNPIDFESNFRFMATGRTVWDMFKMCEKAMPDFVAYPRDFGFESRLFYGLPQWLCKYKYNYDVNDYKLYEQAKSFCQMHEAHSLDSIIDNNIRVNTRGHITNAIGVYTLGGDLSTTPVIMSDKHIDSSRQATKTFDTTSVQDFSWLPGFVDKLLSWTGTYDNGKNLAIKVCVSEIMDSWKNTYDGSLLILGQGEIKAHDLVYLEDTFLSMTGYINVRQVNHSMSVGTGYTTSITPGMVVSNTLKNSGWYNVLRTGALVFNVIKNQKLCIKISIDTVNRASSIYRASKASEYVVGGTKFVKNFMNGPGSEIVKSVKNGKVVTKSVEFVKNLDKLQDGIKVVKGSKTLITAGKVGKTALGIVAAITPAGWAALAGAIAMDIAVNLLLTWVVDMFKYDNTVIIMPLTRKTPSGDMLAFAGNISGSKKLMPVGSETQEVE